MKSFKLKAAHGGQSCARLEPSLKKVHLYLIRACLQSFCIHDHRPLECQSQLLSPDPTTYRSRTRAESTNLLILTVTVLLLTVNYAVPTSVK